MTTFTKIFLGIIAVLLLIQLVPVDRTNPPVDAKNDFVIIHKTPKKIQQFLKNSCYDCHSNETNYPSYAYVAPISWSVKHHINEGREHGNLSVWGTYSKELKKGFLQSAVETIKDKRMPIPGYVAQHPESRLSEAERKILANYFQEILDKNLY